MLIVFLLLIAHWYLSLFCQTFYLHRYAAHGMFSMPYWLDRVFYALTYLTQGPSFLNPRAYALLHQAHHKYSDTDKDPHSPHFFPSVSTMMLQTYHDYHALVRNPQGMRSDHYYPTWKNLDSFATTWWHTILWIALYVWGYSFVVTAWWQYSFLAIHFLMGPIQGAIVNWFGHKLGHRNFDLPDKSRNTLPVDFLLMGELYQNNHHARPMSLNFASRWFEWDPTYPLIRTLQVFRLVKITK
ncbi:MAG: acyl-CoA desaturase [Bacteriovoracaceae bacterium]